MVPYRPVPYSPGIAQIVRENVEDSLPPVPRSAAIIQNTAVVLATASGSILTFMSLSKDNHTVENIFKMLLGSGLAVISISTAVYGLGWGE